MLSTEEVLWAKNKEYLRGVHVVVGTPHCLAELAMEPRPLPALFHAVAVVVDEVDACFQVQCMLTWIWAV